MARFEREQSEYIEKVVATNRVSKTVKGGRVMKFSALMVHSGVGTQALGTDILDTGSFHDDTRAWTRSWVKEERTWLI